jgi:small multidrug resistance family-3 protein
MGAPDALAFLWIIFKLRVSKNIWFGLIGGIVLMLYGGIPTFQPSAFTFGRVYATYGGVFILLSILWGWQIDH